MNHNLLKPPQLYNPLIIAYRQILELPIPEITNPKKKDLTELDKKHIRYWKIIKYKEKKRKWNDVRYDIKSF